ncbi:MAG: hypothetical protein MUE73_02420 [Planctomycetes bacterium]|jgi:hypothetical protein|nr:hypothetical protein [Planctomycetota bacterium]
MPAAPPSSPVPVWGIEAGPGYLHAARVVRTADGKLSVLAVEERRGDKPAHEAVSAFIRRRGIAGHPVVVSLVAPAPSFGTVVLSPEEMLQSAEELREGLLERVGPEADVVDLRYARTGPNVWLLCAEERARVEGLMVALESAGARSWSLVLSEDAVLTAVRTVLGFAGDGLILHVRPEWTSILFLDGSAIRRQSLPIGTRELLDPDRFAVFTADVGRVIEYHRTRVARAAPERIILLGVEGDLRAKLAATLPSPPVATEPAESLFSSMGRVKPPRTEEFLLRAPGALGAAAAGALLPRRLDLAFRPLPETLSLPPGRSRSFFAAAAVLWLALAVAFAGGHLRKSRTPPGPAPGAPSAESVARLRAAVSDARRSLAFPRALKALLACIPGDAAAPWSAEALELVVEEDDSCSGRLVLRLPDYDPASPGERGAALAAHGPPEFGAAPDGTPLATWRIRFEVQR